MTELKDESREQARSFGSDPSLREQSMVVHVASLSVTLERFVEPLVSGVGSERLGHTFAAGDAESQSAHYIPLRLRRSIPGLLQSWQVYRSNLKELMGHRPSIVHVHTPLTALALLPCLPTLKRHGVLMAYTARGSFDESESRMKRVAWWFTDPLKWKVWDGVCVTNQFLLNQGQKVKNRIVRKLSLGAGLPNVSSEFVGTLPENRSHGQGPLRLVWVGRLDADKRFEDFLELVKTINRELPQGCRGEVIGAQLPGDSGTSKEISELVVFRGWVEEPSAFIQQSDLLVSTSIREGYGLVILEAALVGTPCVAVKNHGTCESVPLVRGRLVEKGNLRELVDAVMEFATKDDDEKERYRQEVQRAGRGLVDAQRSREELRNFYLEMRAS